MKVRFVGVLALLFGLVATAAYAVNAVNNASAANIEPVKLMVEQTTPKAMVIAANETPPNAGAVGADGFKIPEQRAKTTAEPVKPLGSDKSPHDVATEAPKDSLKNPYAYKPVDPALVEAGRKKYMSVSCNGCHGGNGGGGMCPPLSNETWVYGADDDTLFRLIALGSDELLKQGYVRKGRENVVGPMPAHGKIVKTEDDLWRIIYFIRANFRGDEKNIKW